MELCKQTNKMHFLMYLFYSLCTTLHVSNDYFVHHQEFVGWNCFETSPNRKTLQTDTFARFVQSCRIQ